MPRSIGLLVGIAVAASGCASTMVSATWRNSNYGPTLPRRVLVAAIVPDEALRLQVEDRLSRELTKQGLEGVPLSSVIPPGAPVDQAAIDAAAKQGNFGGVMVSRYTGTTLQTTSWAWDWGWGWDWSLGWGYYPGYVSVWPEQRFETNFYDERAGKTLVWTGSSATVPSGVDNTVANGNDVAHYAQVVVGQFAHDMGG